MKIDWPYMQSAYCLDSMIKRAHFRHFSSLLYNDRAEQIGIDCETCCSNSPDSFHVHGNAESPEANVARKRLGQILILIGNDLQREPHPA